MKTESTDIINAYENFYTGKDTEWRMLSAKHKAQNIIDVCRSLKPNKVLEVGAGDGSILSLLDKQNFSTELHALEISDSAIQLIKDRNLKNLKGVKKFDGYEIPYEDDSFDLVILAHVLEHVEHERILLRELRRIAKYIVIEVPLDYRFGVDNRIKHFFEYGHINMYTPTLLRYLLRSENLEVVSDKVFLIPTNVTKFNQYVNRGKSPSFLTTLRIELEYNLKKIFGALMGKKKIEQFGNAYTVLCKKADVNLRIL